jgi:hypothetical protein
VIRFHDQHIAAAQVIAHTDRQISEIGGDADLNALCAEGKANRVGRIVRNGEGPDFNVANLKAMARFKLLELFQLRPLALFMAPTPGASRRS